ncbi:tetratricopeptide repeat protein [Streptomyces sp. NPDC057236]|uniref:tetratricopeptide repeat protein n=1 Tax=Streptomyces sp. NPDC057236 TaxID=3346059 RepID=UPI0036398244
MRTAASGPAAGTALRDHARIVGGRPGPRTHRCLPHALGSRHNLAEALHRMGRYAEAVDLHRQNLVARTRVLGPDHPDTLTSRDGLETALLTSARRDGLRRSR